MTEVSVWCYDKCHLICRFATTKTDGYTNCKCGCHLLTTIPDRSGAPDEGMADRAAPVHHRGPAAGRPTLTDTGTMAADPTNGLVWFDKEASRWRLTPRTSDPLNLLLSGRLPLATTLHLRERFRSYREKPPTPTPGAP